MEEYPIIDTPPTRKYSKESRNAEMTPGGGLDVQDESELIELGWRE